MLVIAMMRIIIKKIIKNQLHKIGQSRRFLGRLIRPLLKAGLALMESALKLLAKSVLISLGLAAGVASAADAANQNKIFGWGMTTLIISDEEMNYIMKKVKSLEESCF